MLTAEEIENWNKSGVDIKIEKAIDQWLNEIDIEELKNDVYPRLIEAAKIGYRLGKNETF